MPTNPLFTMISTRHPHNQVTARATPIAIYFEKQTLSIEEVDEFELYSLVTRVSNQEAVQARQTRMSIPNLGIQPIIPFRLSATTIISSAGSPRHTNVMRRAKREPISLAYPSASPNLQYPFAHGGGNLPRLSLQTSPKNTMPPLIPGR